MYWRNYNISNRIWNVRNCKISRKKLSRQKGKKVLTKLGDRLLGCVSGAFVSTVWSGSDALSMTMSCTSLGGMIALVWDSWDKKTDGHISL